MALRKGTDENCDGDLGRDLKGTYSMKMKVVRK